MLGAIAGDIVGSVFEFDNLRDQDFPLFAEGAAFTDDTVLTVALAEALLHGGDYAEAMKRWYARYPEVGYGGRFRHRAQGYRRGPYNRGGDGPATRVSAVGWAFDELETVLDQAAGSAAPTHNHPEGIRAAQTVAGAIFLARWGGDKAEIRRLCERRFGYDVGEPVDSLREHCRLTGFCQGTVPPAVRAFLEAESFEHALRNAVSLGGDRDTLACIAGAIAEPFFGIPEWIGQEAFNRLDVPLAGVTRDFRTHYVKG